MVKYALTMLTMKIRNDCRKMSWDRPCTPHKEEGVHCEECGCYDPVKERILVVKLDALGDVLRTTCILPALRSRYPGAQVTWITMAGALPLLENNPYIDRRVAYGPDALAMLAVERFDLVLGLDAAPRSAACASMAAAKERKGFGLDPGGRVFPFNAEAEGWFLMGLFDDLKKQNTRTYQEIVTEICGLAGMHQEIVVRLTDGEREFARRFAEREGVPSEEVRAGRGLCVIGVNTGSGERWPMKQWPEERCAEFIRSIATDEHMTVLLFGGEEEVARNRALEEAAAGALTDTGCHNSLREFMALVDLCDVLVTSDSLGLHVALGLGKKVVGLFGPTSAAEIDMYGRGLKIVPAVECACCYLRECSRTPTCMEQISADTVRAAVKELLFKKDSRRSRGTVHQ